MIGAHLPLDYFETMLPEQVLNPTARNLGNVLSYNFLERNKTHETPSDFSHLYIHFVLKLTVEVLSPVRIILLPISGLVTTYDSAMCNGSSLR